MGKEIFGAECRFDPRWTVNTLIGPPALYARVAGEHIRETGLTCLGESTPYIKWCIGRELLLELLSPKERIVAGDQWRADFRIRVCVSGSRTTLCNSNGCELPSCLHWPGEKVTIGETLIQSSHGPGNTVTGEAPSAAASTLYRIRSGTRSWGSVKYIPPYPGAVRVRGYVPMVNSPPASIWCKSAESHHRDSTPMQPYPGSTVTCGALQKRVFCRAGGGSVSMKFPGLFILTLIWQSLV